MQNIEWEVERLWVKLKPFFFLATLIFVEFNNMDLFFSQILFLPRYRYF